MVPGCRRAGDGANQEWPRRAWSPRAGGDAELPDAIARGRGRGRAAASVPSTWVLIEAYADDTDEPWLGKTAACSELPLPHDDDDVAGVERLVQRHVGGNSNSN
jgi:hypothetical protein